MSVRKLDWITVPSLQHTRIVRGAQHLGVAKEIPDLETVACGKKVCEIEASGAGVPRF